MSNVPDGLRYTKSHEWFKIDGDIATVGITDYAQKQLTDIVYIELPSVGASKKAGEVLLTVESVKSAEDVYSPFSGKISEVNEALSNSPELINQDSYENWLVKIKLSDPDEKIESMSNEEYKKFVGES